MRKYNNQKQSPFENKGYAPFSGYYNITFDPQFDYYNIITGALVGILSSVPRNRLGYYCFQNAS